MVGPLILQVVLIALNAIFASAEIAVISMNETKLKKMAEDGDRRARHLYTLTEQPAKFLSTIQVAITLAGSQRSCWRREWMPPPSLSALTMRRAMRRTRSWEEPFSKVLSSCMGSVSFPQCPSLS